MKLYEDLQVTQNATQAEIRKSYNKLAKQYHPDKVGKEALGLWHRIRDAYEILSDPVRRREYDERGDTTQPISQIEYEITSSVIDAIIGGPPGMNWIQAVTMFVQEKCKELSAQRENILESIRKCRAAAPKIKKKGKTASNERNPFHEALNAKIVTLEAQAQSKLDTIAVLQARIDFLDKWEVKRERHPGEIYFEAGISFRIADTSVERR